MNVQMNKVKAAWRLSVITVMKVDDQSYESCVWSAVSPDLSDHSQEAMLVQFRIYALKVA